MKALSAEEAAQHRELKKRVKGHYSAGALFEELRLADLTYSHRQIERLQAWREAILRAKIREGLSEYIIEHDRKARNKPFTDYFRNGRPTDAALEILARSGRDLDHFAGCVLLRNLESLATIDDMIMHHRAVRNDAARELESRKEAAQRSQPIALPYTELPNKREQP